MMIQISKKIIETGKGVKKSGKTDVVILGSFNFKLHSISFLEFCLLDNDVVTKATDQFQFHLSSLESIQSKYD